MHSGAKKVHMTYFWSKTHALCTLLSVTQEVGLVIPEVGLVTPEVDLLDVVLAFCSFLIDKDLFIVSNVAN
jgi:hypothetical protein